MTEPPPAQPPPRRERIVAPRRTAPRVAAQHAVSHDIDEQTHVGEVYMRALLRVQLRLALVVIVVFLVVLGCLPLLFVLDRDLSDSDLLGIPVPWLVLGFLVYPVLIGGGWVYVRLAERNEREFAEFVERS
jgi:hypothetical protein